MYQKKKSTNHDFFCFLIENEDFIKVDDDWSASLPFLYPVLHANRVTCPICKVVSLN